MAAVELKIFGCEKHLSQIVHLTDFLKTNLTKLAVKKGQKTGFLRPISWKITPANEKKRKNRKSEEEEREWREKAMVTFLAFVFAASYTPSPMFPCSAPRGPGYRHIGHIRSIRKQTF